MALYGAPSYAADDVNAVLSANRAAMGGDAWNGKMTLDSHYRYVGQGLTGSTASLVDLQRGAFVDSYRIGPTTGANGYDGLRAWEKESSGTVTDQAGGDTLQLAINESYRDRNLWWRSDRGNASIQSQGRKTADNQAFDVLTVTPRDGKPFEAWFSADTHRLARTVEAQVTQTITTFFSDYAEIDGVPVAHTLVVDDGSGVANRQTMSLTSAHFEPARTASAYARPAAELHDYSLAGGVSETTVPFQLINNHIYVQASVNGSKPLTFIVDTGGHDIVTPVTAKLLGVKPQGSQTSTGAGDNVAQSGLVDVDSISVGAATLNRQTLTVLQFSNAAEGIDEQGMIGYEFFARFITRVDYDKQQITFIDKKHFDPKDAGTPVSFRFYHQFPEVLGFYDGIPGRFGIDTGARNALSLTRPFTEQGHLRERETKGVEALTGWGVGGPTRGYVFQGKHLKLGDVDIAGPLTQFSVDKGGAGGVDAFPNNVGGGVLKRFVVTFDYDHQLMYLKPIAGKVDDLDTFDRSGMWINQSTQGFKIVDVSKGTPAAEAGLQADDIITAVDGAPVASIKLYDLRKALRNDAPGTTLRLTVSRKNASRDLRLTLRDLI
ncbi:aspartyl protease family protein [Dyella silvatica]|uniref:aspartyl protease family protein n=1 Tax=Dyella silvatica TaxID=2992128 RepID=UPI002255DCC1|nr:aspartyl protease family protein [Dyella silvatica]